MKTTVSYSFVTEAVAAKWMAELSHGTRTDYYSVLDLAKWSGLQTDALEEALRSDERFEVIAAADAPKHLVRDRREGKNATGYWPFARLRSPDEVADIRSRRERAGRAGEILAAHLRRVTGVQTANVLFDKGRFVVLGLTPEDVASSVEESQLQASA